MFDKDFQQSVRENLGRGIKYTYFVEKTDLIDERRVLYAKIYQELADHWKFVILPAGVFMPFDEVVIYDPRSDSRAWGYAQMKYVVANRQDDDLFLKLP